jgi:hypothetical protein
MSPSVQLKATLNGDDHVVVGRPIKNAPDPIAVVESMQREVRRGLVLPPGYLIARNTLAPPALSQPRLSAHPVAVGVPCEVADAPIQPGN